MPVTSAAERVPAPLLVLAGIVSVQFGGALAQTLVPEIGAGGAVTMRLFFATVLLLVVVRPRWRGHSRRGWLTVGAFGVALGLMNFAFYGSLAYLPIGVAVTIEFIGPLTLAAVLSRRLLDGLAVLAAAVGVVLISEALDTPVDEEFRVGTLGLAFDVDTATVVIEAIAAGEAEVEVELGEADDDADEDPDEPDDDLDRLRVRLTPEATRAFIERARRVVNAGRPPCPLCGQPLDPAGHLCPRHNGYHR